MSLRKLKSKKALEGGSATLSSGKPALDLFHRQWKELEKVQTKLEKHVSAQNVIFERFTEHLEPLERQQCDLIFQLAERLVGFTARKSFTDWQREELHDWLHELITYLESNPFRGEMEIGPLYQQIQANTSMHMDEEMLDAQCEFLRQLLLAECGHCPDDPAELLDMVKNPEKLQAYLLSAAHGDVAEDDESLDDIFAEDDPVADEEHFYQDVEQDAYDHARACQDKEQVDRVEALFKKSSLKQLYRKLALVLHPDREQDTALQEEKTRLMSQLSHAWENKDMFTLLQMAQTHLPETENVLSEENLAVINPILKQRIRALEWDCRRRPEGLMGVVLHRFWQSSKIKTERAFAEHQEYLQSDIRSLTHLITTIGCLKSLKPFLAERRDERLQRAWEEENEWMFI